MKRNSKLSLALHTLGHMADDQERMLTSAEIATHVGTNPVVVRRVLGRLREAGLLISEKGHAGGWRLARSPEGITLADVYIALDESIIASGSPGESPSCSVESALHSRVAGILQQTEMALIEQLGKTTIADVHDD
ncbi:Rrf2 family transcriptional regulator [uncultured Roseobacter sp.]|uniref:RrF2 family transcriptional regulator n=1 Tax=uncultured Roseobacter sp. TaxID=114847 RepID=UPI002601D5F5|nr:Rrf2 family transcriptional regulator [uncultured Roseobacter sp.]